MDRGNYVAHWLIDVARRAGLPDADTLELARATDAAEAWQQVASHCGVSLDQLTLDVAEQMRLPVARFEHRDDHVSRLLPEKIARRFRIVPLREDDRHLVVATDDPQNHEVERAVEFASGRTPIFEIAHPQAILQELDLLYAGRAAAPAAARPSRAAAPPVDEVQHLVERSSANEVRDLGDDAPVVKLTNLILRNAAHERASDIHIEPAQGWGTVRFRVDGVLHVHMRMPLLVLNRVVARIKIMGALDIADRLRPQDGRASFEVDGRSIDLRISTVPTRDAEKCVIRLLRGAATETLNDLHLSERSLQSLRALAASRNGIVVVTGPTGSGKTTTLYAVIRELNNGETNISTVEDPIEYELPGITQMQVEPKRDFTFATALRAILRQDPDVILVGEIRDAETAGIAVQASMTGHLVLTTLHTNEAAGAVARLVDVGVERPALSATLRGVVAQRLVRRLCPHCSEKTSSLNDDELRLSKRYGVTPARRAIGCPQCGKTGYLGRLAIVEILVMTPALQALVSSGATAPELHAAAVQAGMRTLLGSALQRVVDGETTLQEVERVVGETMEAQGLAVAVSAEKAAEEVERPAREDAPRILVVDDDAVCRKVARQQLLRGGFDVTECDSGEAALERLRTDERIGLLVLDLGLPGIQGDEVLRQLRTSAATASLPVIVLTGAPDPELEVNLLESGADDYLLKPIDPRRFVTRVRATLRRRHAA